MKKMIITVFTVLLMGSGVVQAAIYNIGPGEEFGDLILVDNDVLLMTGGEGDDLDLLDSSTVNVFGGSVYQLSAYDTGTVNVSDNADVVILMAGGEAGVANMSGGTVDSLGAIEFGTVNLSGGLVSEYLGAADSGLINIFGYDLSKTASGGEYGYGFVTGEWADGTIFSINLVVADAYSAVVLHEIPEPATLAIVITGVLFLRKS